MPITDPAPLNTNAGSDAGGDQYPQLTTDRAGNWLAVWHSNNDLGGTIGNDTDILVARSTDNGATWTAPVLLNTNAASDAWADGSPQLATDGAGHWLAVWQSRNDLGGTIGHDYDILVARSTDNGATWSAPAPLNSNAGSDISHDYQPQLTTDGAGHWLAVWYSWGSLGGTIGYDNDILVARSTDNGVTWGDPAPLNTNAGSDIEIDDSRPQLTTDGAGHWVAVWDSGHYTGGAYPDNDPDILVARSTDNGATWSDPAPLNANAGRDNGNDQYPQVATDGAGHWLAAWHSNDHLGGTIGSDYDILVARSTDNGVTWSKPVPLNTNAGSDSNGDYRPQLITDGAGNWLAVWHSNDDLGGTIGNDYDILVARSTDNGATWSDPVPLNTNAGSDSGTDWNPQLAADGAGNWVGVWHSDDDLGGTIGNDSDILVARFAMPDCNGNGVVDGQDIAASTGGDCDANGVPDECQADPDDDGVIDPCDGCPGDAGKAAPGQCGCAAVDTDSDGDGTADCNDNCPNDPNKTAPGVCGCNAADVDGDGDGVPDCNDNYPNDANKTAAGVCGCNSADIDGDGVADCIDNCPILPNPDQADSDGNGVGDACEACGAGLCGVGVLPMLPLTVLGLGCMKRRRRASATLRIVPRSD